MSLDEILWCCHARGPDDVYAAPDYQTALIWSDILNETNWRTAAYPKPSRFENPRSYADCLVKAVPAPWPHSPESHAEDLPKSIEGFRAPDDTAALPASKSPEEHSMALAFPKNKSA